jgi:hypothetical protein
LLRKLPFPLKGEVLPVESSYALLAPPPWILNSILVCWISEWIKVKGVSSIYSFSYWASLAIVATMNLIMPRWSRYV